MKSKLSILVIDDENSLEDIFKTFLDSIGAEVIYCNHPQKGWREIEKQVFDLIITDLKMPVISGDEFIKIVRSSRLNICTPIILCSGFINKLVVTEMAREGKVYFLSKPFDCTSLLELVEKAVGSQLLNVHSGAVLSEKWLFDFRSRLGLVTKDVVITEELKQFEIWNFESIGLNAFIARDKEMLSVTMLMKQKTFLKIAGLIQGTQYKNIEAETLLVWQDFIKQVHNESGQVTFSKVLSQEILLHSSHKNEFYKFVTPFGEILAYLN